jgi:predicted ATP-binding protein involved in virulence
MAILRLIAQGVGPFESLDIDFSDGNGKPHLGPHILAGVNGSGKSTVLRAIAWVMDRGELGFQYDDWLQALKGYRDSRALLVMEVDGGPEAFACSKGSRGVARADLSQWARRVGREFGFEVDRALRRDRIDTHSLELSSNHVPHTTWLNASKHSLLFQVAAYSPSKALRHLANPDLTQKLKSANENSLAFESTVQNDAIQSWLLGLYSKRAIARERKQPSDEYSRSLGRFESALRLMYDQDVKFDVEIEPIFQPCLNLHGTNLNFSQLPDGVRSTVAWIADFMMRQDLAPGQPGILLLDEIDAHLHPRWQRELLPAMREALPDVQMIVTSHSPFVISSCPGARVHVLETDELGRAHCRPPMDSPIGESVTTTLKEIFGVDSRFDVLTERQLNEWNELRRREVTGKMSAEETARLVRLTQTLSERSEELKSIVASPRTIPASAAAALLGAKPKNGRGKREKAVLH